MSETKPTFEEGRKAQYRQMMEQLELLRGKYKGVRGELLAKVQEELQKLEPSAPVQAPPVSAPSKKSLPVTTPKTAATAKPAPDKVLPSCRACGRGMKLDAVSGNLICQNGHTRSAA